ncbi:MAG TPA: hypothetical protein VMG12_30675 [Polyangiaceae bacterium]|nr:hypothetical protein [Polyangiaceae bacterium]
MASTTRSATALGNDTEALGNDTAPHRDATRFVNCPDSNPFVRLPGTGDVRICQAG